MGTDIHPKLFVQRGDNEKYWEPLKQPTSYHGIETDCFAAMNTLGLPHPVKMEPVFPSYEEWRLARPDLSFDESYSSWDRERLLDNCTKLLRDPAWIEFENHLSALRQRDYDYFAILANVRNGRGFAGVDLGDEFIPIQENRPFTDLPFTAPDLAVEGLYDYGDHSFGWITLREWIDYPHWKDIREQRGVVNLHPVKTPDPDTGGTTSLEWASYEQLRGTGKAPTHYYGGIGGQKVAVIDTARADAILDGKMNEDPDKEYHVRYAWNVSVGDSVNLSIHEAMGYFASHLNPDTTYLVFGFDS
jgi:hypothetical protein